MQKTIIALRQALSSYDAREAQSIIDLLLEEVCQLSRIDRIMNPGLQLPDAQRQRLLRCAQQLSQGIPVQQALGYEWFCGERFKVTPDVLIPRPETAELVHWICQDAGREQHSPSSEGRKGPFILDVGTGTGCIALSLARLINHSQVLGIDLSTAALAVARENKYQQGVDNAYFAKCDILRCVDKSYFESQIHQQLTSCPHLVFNIIVSNPPYICQQEAAAMSPVVLDHEPSLALFVPDDDPLLFYRAIAQFGREHLTTGGALYFEINASYGSETCAMLRDLGYQNVQLRQDIHGRDRMVKGEIGNQHNP